MEEGEEGKKEEEEEDGEEEADVAERGTQAGKRRATGKWDEGKEEAKEEQEK